MNKLTVQSEDLHDQSNNIAKGAADVNGVLAQLTSQIANLAAQWEGGASQAFQSRWQDWQNSARQVHDAMENMGQFLGQAAQSYEQTEAGIQSAASSH